MDKGKLFPFYQVIFTNKIYFSDGNIVAQAPSGSGKTLAIAVGLLTHVAVGSGVQAICICHTRELCIQTWKYVKDIASGTEIKIAIAVPPHEKGSTTALEPGMEESCKFNLIIHYHLYF